VTFKQNWEKAGLGHHLPDETLEAMVELAFPGRTIQSKHSISEGCANLNYVIEIAQIKGPFILRIYLRDQKAAYREQKLGQLLKQIVPIPQIHFISNYESYRFAIAEYLPGISLRDLLLGNRSQNFGALLVDTGLMLTKIRSYVFEEAGFFDEDLKITRSISQQGYSEYGQQCLREPVVEQIFSPHVLGKMGYFLKKYQAFFPDEQETHLVHADFDPANILVVETDKEWQISGILDWEFSFSGSSLCDIANMLRYAHQMPAWFERGFLQGLKKGGYRLPEHWRISVHLLNLLSLLDCLIRSCGKRPNQRKDICALLGNILTELSRFAEIEKNG